MSTFIIASHQAARAGPHMDLYLKNGERFLAWALPKGLPSTKGVKHLAIKVADHTPEQVEFEGTVPSGQYGAGTKEIWDEGTYVPFRHILSSHPVRIDFFGSKIYGTYYLKHFQGNKYLIWRT